MRIRIVSPSKALIVNHTPDEMEYLRKQLTYTNTSAAHLVKRHYNNVYYKSKNPTGWQIQLDALKAEVTKTLVFEDNQGIYIRPGSIPHIQGLQIEVENTLTYPKAKKIPWNKPLPFTLYDYQEESWTKLLDVKHGGVSLATGSGKSAIILKLLRELGTDSVVMVPSKSIFNEVLEKMEYHLGKGLVGAYGDGKKRLGKKFTIAISDSLVNLKPGTQEYDFFKNKKAFIADECFPYRTYVHTDSGPRTIGEIHKDFQSGKPVMVLSFNEKTKSYEYNRVSNSWKREPKEKLVSFSVSGMAFKCTPDHLLLTSNGWEKAANIQIGDELVSKRGSGTRSSVCLTLNDDQEQVFLGSYLGDGSVSESKNGIRLRIIHGIKQEEYLRWKASIFNVGTFEELKENGYSKKPAIRFSTKLLSLTKNIKLSSPKKEGIKEVLSRLDARGVAIWFMDDGSLNRGSAYFHTQSFPLETQEQFVKFFKTKFDIDASIKEDKGADWSYYYLRMDKTNTFKLLDLIEKYMHGSMAYKTLNGPFVGSYRWDNKYLDFGYTRVSKITIFEPKKTKNYNRNKYLFDLYDLEVENNHNFLVGKYSGIVAHNCHTLPSETLEKVCHGVLSDVSYRFFLSATHTRGDGSTPLLQSITGPIVCSLSTAEAKDKGYIHNHDFAVVQLESSNPNFSSQDALEMKRVHFLGNRNIAAFIAKFANAQANINGLQTLILVEELSQIAMLKKLITVPMAYAHSESRKERLIELGLEKVKPAESVEAFNCNEVKVLIGTSCIATGTNIYPTHNCFNWVGGTSEVKTKQGAVGRTVRLWEANPYKEKCLKVPIKKIWDFDVIDVQIMRNHLKTRLEFYADSGSEIKTIKLNR